MIIGSDQNTTFITEGVKIAGARDECRLLENSVVSFDKDYANDAHLILSVDSDRKLTLVSFE